MDYSDYLLLLLIVNGLLLFMGLHLMLGAISPELKGSAYHIARKIAGAAFMVTPVAAYIFSFCNINKDIRVYLATATNLTSFYLSSMLFSIALLIIIGNKIDKLKFKFNLMASSFIIYLVPTWGAIIFNKYELVLKCHIISNIILIVYIVLALLYIHVVYKRLIDRLNHYYSEDIHKHIKWVKKTLYFFVGLGVIASISPFSNNYTILLCLIYVIYQAITYIYTYTSFQRFEIITLSLAREAEGDDTEPIPVISTRNTNINKETELYIEKRLNEWIKQEYYTVPGLTLKSVARQICTNRTYLSSYINNRYKQPFKEWITILRVDESKKLLCSNKEYSIAEIALKVGFSSKKTYKDNFIILEGITPLEWRVSNKNFKYIN